MTSSTLTGERSVGTRPSTASSDRTHEPITNAVPKPINLPSQRLENHGLDPNVEIVPKGTYSWGTRSSSSTPNAWGSSTLSPNTDGGSGSPSHLSGRPSSGGSGTRPSNASSDRTHEPITNAVPKPINLPSQRLENHGLDPNVEIVPKGIYSWGTKSSSSTPNARGSSTLSPNTDGGSGSPSHLIGRPSSGGSGTRPSTASSDRTHEPITNAVPKPINLPSQRLENHGLDPNVEIVPKGTYSWGTRSSSSTPNAWGSSTLSPNTDGGSYSPSHLSGRPSSGGSGT
ncbi:PROTEIN MODIFIER OF SNC1 1 [Salix koriyanagi]|uniref:PROTEIN MODIFIER OF SNC1 1 n=1 Tax=Salix koriyanagi TaxID=2511006 RepID=A0A9Q0W675_9ROSI|nr:PROTEIN MODIFIER OF SNC1 1 [Salix koriyanagi]